MTVQPKLRFKGFTDDWEKRRLGELAIIQGGGTPSSTNSDYWNGNINWFTPTEVSNTGYVKDSARKITKLGLKKSSAKLLPKGTVLMTSRAGVGDMGILKVPATTNQGFQSMIPNEDVPSYFLYSMQSFISKEANRLASGSTFSEISGKQVSKISINIPSEQGEKVQIGKLFEQLNNLITVNQRKVDLLKKKKSAYLQKLFPKTGSNIPELRFKGYTDTWEKRKLYEIVKITMGQSPNSKNYTDNPKDYILVQGNADIRNGRVVPRVWTTQITKKADKNDLILSVRAPVGDIGKTDFEVVLGRGVAAIKGNEFVYQTLSKMKINGYWKRFSTGSTFESINSIDIKNAEIFIPSDNEQYMVGTFFKSLDNLITVNQRKVDLLKKKKKALLQQMFI
ncbi:restriction endonuclease subunit S [Weissella sagaensis]|uniref:restriction endonuclease subunit S n=1 Tax=Weissella sagaensis TaxID=2559928 RepID=UPI00214C8321|nr:restriction endonuclease subunit S [Weissella sagaensis]